MDYDKGAKPTKREQLPTLRGVQFYTLTLSDLDGNGEAEWLGLGEPGLNEQSTLYVWDKQGDILWSGDKKLGGTNNAILLGEAPFGDPPPRISFNSRLLVTDIDGDGSNELLAIKNIPLVKHVVNFVIYKKSNLIAYRVQGTSLSPAWTTTDIDYCLVDMQAENGKLFLAAQKGRVSNIGKGSGLIMWFE